MAKNLYQKVAEARTRIGVTKDGVNKFGGYKYFQITDIYKEAKSVLAELGVITSLRTEFKDDLYCFFLDVIDTDSESTLLYSIMMPFSEQKGSSKAQCIGGMKTYAEKYLWCSFLMIDDNAEDPDRVNKHEKDDNEPAKPQSAPKPDFKGKAKPATPQKKMSPKENLQAYFNHAGVDPSYVGTLIKDISLLVFGTAKTKLTEQEAQTLLDKIQSGEIDINK